MTYSLAILGTILIYTWLLEPGGVPVYVPAALVVALGVASALRSGTWGWSARAFLPGLRAALLFTIPAAIAVLAAGAALGTLHARDRFAENLAFLLVWGGAQQWILQTVVLREARRVAPPRSAIVLAALLFALVHLPNPFLTAMTFAGGLAWCAIYTRHPHIAPLALSHALATLALLYAFDDRITGRLRIGQAYLER